MVKADDIGKKATDFLNKDFFSNNEIKITTGCCANKHTTNLKIGEAVKGDYKIEYAKLKSGIVNGPVSVKLLSDSSAEVELKHSLSDFNVNLKLNTGLATFDIGGIGIEKKFDYSRDVAGIKTCFDGKIRTQGLGLGASNFGLSFDKDGIQAGYTTTIGNLLAPEFSGCNLKLGWAKCSHFQVFAQTSDCKSVLVRALLNKDGDTYAAQFNSADMKCSVAKNVPFGKAKVTSDGLLIGFTKTPISDTVAFKSSSTINLKNGIISGLGLGLEFDL